MYEIIGSIICIPFIIWFAIGIVYESAKADRQLTFRNTGEIKFVARGGKIIKVITDLPGRTYDADKDLVLDHTDSPTPPPPSTREPGKLVKILRKAKHSLFKGEHSGIAYVSIFYPLTRIIEWEFTWTKLQAKTKTEGSQDNILEKYNIIERDEPVKSLYCEFTYPIVAKDVELAGNFNISVLINVILVVRRPVYLIGYLKGKFMPQVITEISGLIDNKLSKLDIEDWRKANKEDIIDQIFRDKHIKILDGAIEVKEASYVMFDYSGNSTDVISALTKNRINEELGKAKVTEATYDLAAAHKEAEKITTLANAEASSIKNRFAAAHEYAGGMDVLRTELLVKGMQTTGIKTLVWGDSKSMIAIPTDPAPETPPVKEKTKKDS